jgi:hypothetical protein
MDAFAKQYEQNAKVALVLAETTNDMAVRKRWLNVAREWVALAKEQRDFIAAPTSRKKPGLPVA